LKDLNNRNAINLSKFNNIVLDEVDRMLDMGFIDDIKFLVSKLPAKKQALFFSATMPREAHTIASQFLNDPAKIEIENSVTSKNIEQDIVRVEGGKSKLEVLHDLLIQEEFKKVLIFTKTKHGSDRLARDLVDRGFKADAIHGDKAQNKRERVIAKFKSNQINILVATDVAARGLDIKDVTHVINYDEPANYEDYIHRIGRTGRAGKMGKALTFVG
jgi:superfamily II DNA/RNA helicase